MTTSETTLAGRHVAERAYWKELVDRVLKETSGNSCVPAMQQAVSDLAVPTRRLPVELQAMIKVTILQILNSPSEAIPPLAFQWWCNQHCQHKVDSVSHGSPRGTLNPTGEPNPSTGGTQSQNNQQEQPAEVSIPLPRQNISDRTPTHQQNHTGNLVGHAENEVCGRAETVVANEANDRLVNAAMLNTLDNSMGLKRTFDDHMTRGDGSPTSGMDTKRQKIQSVVHSTLLEEINLINADLFDTVISITGYKDGGTAIEFSYTEVSLARDMKLPFTAYGMSALKPAKLFVPDDYPQSSPMLCTDDGDE